jgi:hypothetical protein
MPFSIQTMAWSCEYRAFVVEEFIQNGGSSIMYIYRKTGSRNSAVSVATGYGLNDLVVGVQVP